jgi:DNA-binding MarR family transcriptional regulator
MPRRLPNMAPNSLPAHRVGRAAELATSASDDHPLPPERTDHDLDHSIGYLLNRAASIIAARFSDDLKPFDINLQAWRVLAALRQEDHQTLSDLGSHTGAELSYLSRTVGALEARGFVRRRDTSSDRRNIHLSLTAAGAAVVAQLSPRAGSVEATATSGMTARERKIVLKALRRIYDNLVDSGEDGPSVNRKLTVARRVRRRGALEPPSS